MGVGKTTLGKKLATRLKFSFEDLDMVLEKREGKSIGELISQQGQTYFREAESRTLQSVSLQKTVVACGGGAPCFFDNLKWMKENGSLVYLKASESFLCSRLLQTNLAERPLLKDLNEDSLRSFIHKKLQERAFFYEQAHHTFTIPETNVEVIARALGF